MNRSDDLKARHREKSIARLMVTCRHFRGIQHETCEAGVALAPLRCASGPGLAKWPCLTLGEGPPAKTTCALRSLPTREEAEVIEDETEKRIDAFLAKMALGVCQCGVEGTAWTQGGACIYAEPCGHRIGQGDAEAFTASVLKARAERAAAP